MQYLTLPELPLDNQFLDCGVLTGVLVIYEYLGLVLPSVPAGSRAQSGIGSSNAASGNFILPFFHSDILLPTLAMASTVQYDDKLVPHAPTTPCVY